MGKEKQEIELRKEQGRERSQETGNPSVDTWLTPETGILEGLEEAMAHARV